MSATRETESVAAGIVADLLDQGVIVHRQSIIATGAAVFFLIAAVLTGTVSPAPLYVFLAVPLLGLGEAYLAMRIGFDAALFRKVARDLPLPALDEAMVRLGIIEEGAGGRSLQVRFGGCRQLLRRQVISVALQYLLIVLGSVFAWS